MKIEFNGVVFEAQDNWQYVREMERLIRPVTLKSLNYDFNNMPLPLDVDSGELLGHTLIASDGYYLVLHSINPNNEYAYSLEIE